MQLFNTKVIPSFVDAEWQAPPLPDMSGAKLLVISKPFPAGGAEEGTLQKMMAACKLSASDYVVLQMDKPYAWQSIAGAGAPKAALLLGVLPAALSIHALFRLHAPNAFGGNAIVPALSLEEIERSPAAKKDLWDNGLKPLLGL